MKKYEFKRIKIKGSKRHTDYIELIYNGHPTPEGNHSLDLYVKNNEWFQPDTSKVRAFVDYIETFEKLLQVELDRRKLTYTPQRLVRQYLKIIESVQSGLDVRSSWTQEGFATKLVDAYDKIYTEAKTECEETLEFAKTTENFTYLSSWRRTDKYKRTNEMFEFNMPDLEQFYAPKDEIDKIGDALGRTIALLNDDNFEYQEAEFFNNNDEFRFVNNMKQKFNCKVEFDKGAWFTLAENRPQYKATSIKSRAIEKLEHHD